MKAIQGLWPGQKACIWVSNITSPFATFCCILQAQSPSTSAQIACYRPICLTKSPDCCQTLQTSSKWIQSNVWNRHCERWLQPVVPFQSAKSLRSLISMLTPALTELQWVTMESSSIAPHELCFNLHENRVRGNGEGLNKDQSPDRLQIHHRTVRSSLYKLGFISTFGP